LLLKDELQQGEIEKVKVTARSLLEKLEKDKLVLDWKEKESTRAGVKNTIYDTVYNYLPEPIYTEDEYDLKVLESLIHPF